MVRAQVVPVFAGRNYRVLGGAALPGLDCGSAVLPDIIFDDRSSSCPDADLGRPCIRLAVLGVHYFYGGRHPVILHRHRRAVSVQDVSGDEAPPNIHFKGFQR